MIKKYTIEQRKKYQNYWNSKIKIISENEQLLLVVMNRGEII